MTESPERQSSAAASDADEPLQETNLCGACQRISVSLLKEPMPNPPSCWTTISMWRDEISSDKGMVHLKNACDLKISAETCALCALLADEFLDNYHSWDCVSPEPILLSPRLRYAVRATPQDPEPSHSNFPYSSEQCSTLTGMEVWIPTDDTTIDKWRDGYLHFAVRFFTDDSSPHTFQDITSRLPLRDTGGPRAFSRLNSYITACQERHPGCFETVAGTTLGEDEKPVMPTRVIDIGPRGSGQNPRLIRTNGSHGDYVALSHCWGKHQPIKTTKDTLQHHMEGLSWAEFPRTFQHAMRITREIGLRYLWIDSLCILQGDREEWLRESKNMGAVYENAYLVVAAADARDSTGGCFFRCPTSPNSGLIKIPYVEASGAARGSLYVRPRGRDEDEEDPDENECPLSTRAWITQEWILARRIVFYTRKGIIWSCRTIRSLPSGTNSWSHRSDVSKWLAVIQAHASRDLTYFTDRLISLDGIRTEMQKRDHGVYKFGMFEEDLQTQLIWQVHVGSDGEKPEFDEDFNRIRKPRTEESCARRNENPIKAPSWSWASSMAKVEFFKDWGITTPFSTQHGQIDCGDVVFEGDAVVIPKGTIMKLKPADWDENTSRARVTIAPWAKAMEEEENDEVDSDEDADPHTDHEEEQHHWYSDIESDGSVDYFDSYPSIRFDEGTVPSLDAGPLFAVLLASKHMYWADNDEIVEQYFIVLQPCPEGPADTYTRVGAGMVSNDWRDSRALRFNSKEKRRIYIV